MKIITKYILKEHISPFIFGLSAIVFIFILNVVFRDLGRLLGKGLPILVILEFFFLNIAWILALAIPMAVLISCLSTFGRLSSDNEITALKASGTNLYKLITPVLIAAAVLAVGLERFNNLVLPDFNYRASLLWRDISKKRPMISLEPHIFFNEIPDYGILVHSINDRTNELKGIIIHDASDSKKNRTIIAQSGTLNFSEADERMILVLSNGEIHETERNHLQNYQRYLFAKQTFSFSLDNMSLKRSSEKHRGDREKDTLMMKHEIEGYRNRILERENRIRTLMNGIVRHIFPSSWQLVNDSLSAQVSSGYYSAHREPKSNVRRLFQQVDSELNIINGYRRSIRSLQVEIDKKIAIPVACLVFVLIGVPLGIMAHQGGMTAWIVSLIFFLIYWFCLIGGEQLADRGYISPWIAMWAANVIVGTFGIYLVVHTVKETTFIHWEQWWFKLRFLVKKEKHQP
ncbi:LptF/LptG family permease [bacterium]|nr:LptF/LptG family permease [bacterium]